MTAICGFHGRRREAAAGLAAMLGALSDYGVERTQWTEGEIGLGCRSHPLPHDAAGPPLRYDRETGLAITADARLDDREAFCGALGLSRSERLGLSDAELILRAFVRWGRDCPNHLLGDYAFAVWDGRRRSWFCARDHVGARPLYYALTPEGFVFASAVEAVLAVPGVPDELDEAMVAAYLTRMDLKTTTRTLFTAVCKLPPGHTLTSTAPPPARDRRTRAPLARLERYWRPEHVPRARPASDDAYAEEFLDLFSRAVKDRSYGPDPVGAHLSGGLDSSSVAVLAARALRRRGRPPPLAFSWLPPLGGEPPSPAHVPEYAHIDAVCAREALQVFHCALSPDDVVAVLRRDGAYPGIQSHINEEATQRCAAERGVRVLLSGWGGDEGVSFNGAGYERHLLLSGRWRLLLVEGRGREPLRHLAGTALSLMHPDLRASLRRGVRRLRGVHERRWFIDPALERRTRFPTTPILQQVGTRRTQLARLQSGHLSARMEGWAASGARHGIEYRYPLLDRRVLEFALGLPPEQFRRGKQNRWLMRHALRPVLPPEVCWNPSKGDPARVEPLIDAFAEALPIVRRMLDARIEPSARARYIDMRRLRERLDAARFRKKPWLVPLQNTLLFLDF